MLSCGLNGGWMRPWSLLFLVLGAGSAWAEDCESAYTMDELLTDLAMAEGAVRSGDNLEANTLSAKMAAGLACVDEVMPDVMVPRIYRAVGGGMFVGGDPDLGLLWLRTAAALDPEYDYVANEVAEDHPVISGWKLARLEVMEAEPAVPLDRELFLNQMIEVPNYGEPQFGHIGEMSSSSLGADPVLPNQSSAYERPPMEQRQQLPPPPSVRAVNTVPRPPPTAPLGPAPNTPPRPAPTAPLGPAPPCLCAIARRKVDI